MKFAQSSSGRLFTLGIGIALAGSGAAALIGGAAGGPLLSVGLMLGIVCSILAVGLGIDDHPGHVAGAIIGLPFALFLFSQLQGLIAKSHSPAAYALVALGLGAVARAAFVGSSAARPEVTSSTAPEVVEIDEGGR